MQAALRRAADLAATSGRYATRAGVDAASALSTGAAATLAPETTRWGTRLLSNSSRKGTYVTTASTRADIAADADAETAYASQAAWVSLFVATPAMSPELVDRLLQRLEPAAFEKSEHPAHALCLALIDRLASKRMPIGDATLLSLLVRDFLRDQAEAGRKTFDVDQQRRYATILWSLVEQHNPDARHEALYPPDSPDPPLQDLQRRSSWDTQFGEPGYVKEATEKLKAHFADVFGTTTPPLTCPNKQGPLRLTPPQEVVKYLYDPATGPARMRFVIVQRPGLGKTLSMLAAFAAHWNAWKAALVDNPALRPPPFLLLALPAVQSNMSNEIDTFGEQLGIVGIKITMIDPRYANQANLLIIRRTVSSAWGATMVDEAQDLVDLSVDKQRNAGGATATRMYQNTLLVAKIIQNECHPKHAVGLVTGTALGTLDKLVDVVNGGSGITEGTLVECMALYNTDVFPALRPRIGNVPGKSTDDIGTYRPFSQQDVVLVPFAAALSKEDAATDEDLAKTMAKLAFGRQTRRQKVQRAAAAAPTVERVSAVKKARPPKAPSVQETDNADTAASATPTYMNELQSDLKRLPKSLHNKLPDAKYNEKANCMASYIGYLTTNYRPEFKEAVATYPFALAPKLAACAAAALRMHYESHILDAGRSVTVTGVDTSLGVELAMVTFECDGTVCKCVRKVHAREPENGRVARASIGEQVPSEEEPPDWIDVELSNGEHAYVSNAPTDDVRPRQLILLDTKHGFALFRSIVNAVAKRLYPSKSFDASRVVYELQAPSKTGDKERDEKARDAVIAKMDAEFNKNLGTPFCWLVAAADKFSESVDIPGLFLNPICLLHYLSIPVDSKGRGNASKFMQGMLRAARFCRSRYGWDVRLVVYQLHKHAQTTVQKCDENALNGLRAETASDFGPGGPVSKFREYAIDRYVMEHINDGTSSESVDGGARAAVRRWFDIDLRWVQELAALCADQDKELRRKPCVDHTTSDCPAPLCRAEAGTCVSRPEGTVCDDLLQQYYEFDAWSRRLTSEDIDALRTQAEAAARCLVNAGAFAGADVTRDASETLGDFVRKVSAQAMRLARLGRYQPYFDPASVTPRCQALADDLVAATLTIQRPSERQAQTLACAALMHAWTERPEFDMTNRHFVEDVLPVLTMSVGNRLFALGIPRNGTTGEAWYDTQWWFNRLVRRKLAQGQTAVTEHGAQLARNVGGAWTDVKRSTKAAVRRILGYEPDDEPNPDASWASSPDTLFAWALLRQMQDAA